MPPEKPTINPDFFAQPIPDFPASTDHERKVLWPQAAGELLGFANALDRGNVGLTAAQIRLAVKLANERCAVN